MQYWVINPAQYQTNVSAAKVARLVAEIGSSDRTALAAAILDVTRESLPAHHCAVLSFEAERSPRMLSAAGLDNHHDVFKAGSAYTREFFPNDGVQKIIRNNPLHISTLPRSLLGGRLVVHRQSCAEISHQDYRSVCYDSVSISDRIAVLIRTGAQQWISTHLYRDRSAGVFSAGEINAFLGLAPLLAGCVSRHYAQDVDGETSYRGTVTEDVGQISASLTTREREVLLRLLDGLTTERIAEDLRIRPTTVVTYRTRAYEKLGVRSRRELFAAILRRHQQPPVH